MKKIRTRYLVLLVSLPFVLYAILGGFLGKALAKESPYRYLSVFQDVVTLLVNNYVEPVELNQVMDGAIRGMMDALDPDSCYLSPKEFDEYENPSGDKEAGIGVEVAKRYYIQLVAVLPGSPAEKAGLKPDDLLKSIDGKNTREVNIIAGESLLRGTPGSKLELVVVRGRTPDPLEITVEREIRPGPPVAYKMLPDATGYVRIASFQKGTAHEVVKGIQHLHEAGAEEMVLDVRNSSGRSAEDGARVAELFVSGGVAAQLQSRSGEKSDVELAANRVVFKGPLVVLMNHDSSGAAEIMVSALRHANRAELVGEQTSGRSAVQKAIPLGDGSALVLSVSQYFTPDDKPILGEGLEPTVEVKGRGYGEDEVGDPILEKALEILGNSKSPAKVAA